jgi:hypothetical protein
MQLNCNETYKKIIGLFPTMPYNSIEYCGCWKPGTVVFKVGTTDKYNNYIAGVEVTVTQDFKLVSKQRLFTTWGRISRKQSTITEKIPLHPLGTIPYIYKRLQEEDQKEQA